MDELLRSSDQYRFVWIGAEDIIFSIYKDNNLDLRIRREATKETLLLTRLECIFGSLLYGKKQFHHLMYITKTTTLTLLHVLLAEYCVDGFFSAIICISLYPTNWHGLLRYQVGYKSMKLFNMHLLILWKWL